MGTARADPQPAPGCPPLGMHTPRFPSPVWVGLTSSGELELGTKSEVRSVSISPAGLGHAARSRGQCLGAQSHCG